MTDCHETGQEPDNPGIRIHPPLVLLAVILTGVGLQKLWALQLTAWPGWPVAGWVLIGVGVAILVTGWVQFYRARTDVLIHRPASTLIQNGLYRRSRNPIYVSALFVQLGIGLRLNNLWIVLLVAVTMFIFTKYVIAREEAYLERAFGEGYVDYTRKVRRWL